MNFTCCSSSPKLWVVWTQTHSSWAVMVCACVCVYMCVLYVCLYECVGVYVCMCVLYVCRCCVLNARAAMLCSTEVTIIHSAWSSFRRDVSINPKRNATFSADRWLSVSFLRQRPSRLTRSSGLRGSHSFTNVLISVRHCGPSFHWYFFVWPIIVGAALGECPALKGGNTKYNRCWHSNYCTNSFDFVNEKWVAIY